MMRRGVVILLGVLLCYGQALAEAVAVDWSQLSEQQQTVLKPFQGEWDTFSEERRTRLLKGVERWQGMKPEQRKIMSKRFNHWNTMSPQQKFKVRQHFKRFRQLPPGERELLKHKYQRFQQMPTHRRQVLRDRWKNLTPGDRKEFREKRMQRMREHRLEQGLPDTPGLPADRGLNRTDLKEIQPIDATRSIILDR